MNQPNNLAPRGIIRDETEFLKDYRQRAFCIGFIQLAVSICYLPIAYLQHEMLLISSSIWDREYMYSIQSGNQSLGRFEIQFQTPGLDAVYSKLYFWMAVNIIRSILHTLSSILLIWAITEDISKLRAIRICNWTRTMNLIFLLCEIVVYVFMYQEWEFAVNFTLFRFLFHHEIGGLLNTIQTLSARPPGHH